MIRCLSAVLLWCVAAGLALVAASSYLLPLLFSLAATLGFALVVSPWWRQGKHRVWIALTSAPLVFLAVESVARLVSVVEKEL